ncbi:MAG TPA: sigma-70 region 4 domain-containing protein [Acidobacteriaceae bacterium]|nr:sigma-70 region 4 domain-containing protein [Acidobacteriaceae bacterium]
MSSIAQTTCEIDCSRPVVTIAAEFADSWIDEVSKLYLLSFLLTADKALAEQCFSGAMDEYVGSSALVASDWVWGHGKAAVVRRAVQLIRPVPKSVHCWSFADGRRPLLSAAHQPFSAITLLGAFERFVFVLSVLEGYSVEECATMLDCSVAAVVSSRDLANTLTSDWESGDEIWQDCDSLPATTALIHQHCSIG